LEVGRTARRVPGNACPIDEGIGTYWRPATQRITSDILTHALYRDKHLFPVMGEDAYLFVAGPSGPKGRTPVYPVALRPGPSGLANYP
jgi:hypothetical protein